jgi:hypothetical protein
MDANKKDRASDEILLTEYTAAQESAQHHDAMAWTSTGISWGLVVIFLGFAFSNLHLVHLRVPLTIVALVGLLLIAFQWQVHALCRRVKRQKYQRCNDIELLLGMTAHRALRYREGANTFFYRVISAGFALLLIAALYSIWFGSTPPNVPSPSDSG